MAGRFLTARKQFSAGKIPTSALLYGPISPALELADLAGGIDVTWEQAIPILSTQAPRDEPMVLRVWDLGEPAPAQLEAIQGMRRIRNIRLIGYSPGQPAEPWTKVFDRQITTQLSHRELQLWVQLSLGGAYSTVATRLLDRVGWDVDTAAREVRKIHLVCNVPTPEDVAELVDHEPALHFFDALVRCDLKTARRYVSQVRNPAGILRGLEERLLQFWSIIEARPAITVGKAREAARLLALDPELTKALVPYARYYSRQKIAARLRALAMVDVELRRGTPAPGLLEVLVTLW